MKESFATKKLRWQLNFFPAFRRTGGRLSYISEDRRNLRVTLPLNWKTRNIVGSIFGGSIYAAVDPIYMVMLIKILGPDYLVWDKAASVQYLKPARSRLTAKFNVEQQVLDSIYQTLTTETKMHCHFQVELRDTQGELCALVDKTIYIRKK